ncbi:MAG TPA: tetratricopeptide repeat protein, partial [Anaerolineales bacterium]|nr:tetratricopeptide repeat protein [Anaerolineales bacterium]
MAKISLRMYNREIEGLTEQQRLDEAIAHCRHILRSYPKHLETYRLLGKGYLEAKRYDQAVDIFQRILVAAPDDFVSHVGMSIIADDNGKLDDAIWHMERAFEVQPSNAAIQGELQRLFGRRDGVEPPKIRLTRGALAHMYVQGELYSQAISEIRLVLANDPQRADMQALLARAFFRSGQKAEATETSTELLSRFPYCLDANRLMAEILPGTQHPEAAEEYRQRVIELDPYAAFVQDSLFRSDTVADGVVMLERLDYTGQTAEMAAVLGLEPEEDSGGAGGHSLAGAVTAAAAAKDLPVWLASPQEPKAVEPEPSPTKPGALAASVAATAAAKDLPVWLAGPADEAAVKGGVAATEPPKEDLPDFMRDAGWAAAAAGSESAAPFASEPAEETPASGVVEGDLPDWVKALAPAAEPPASPVASALPPEPTAFAPKKPTFGSEPSDDTPGWLRGLSDAEPSQVSASAAPVEAAPAAPAEMPDWLRDMEPANVSAVPAPAAEAPEETPDWLKDLAGHELDEPAPPVKPAAESDWFADLRPEQPTAAAEPAEETPGWIKEFDNDLETPLTKTEATLPGTTPQPATAPTLPAAPPASAASAEPAAGIGSLGTSAQEQDDAMAWLESLAAKHGAKPEELVTDPNARTNVAPEWVDKAKEIGESAEPSKPAAAEDETGMWLRGLAAGAAVAGVSKAEEEKNAGVPASSAQQVPPAAAAASSREEVPAARPPVEVPPGFSGFAPTPVEPAAAQEAPEWLHKPDKEEEEPVQPVAAMPAPPQVPAEAVPGPAAEAGDLPAWLAGLDQEGAPAASGAAAPSEELPA